MQRKNLSVVFFCFISLFLFSVSAFAAEDLKNQAIKNFQRALVKVLPVEGNIVRITVLDLEGDDGTIRNAVVSAITEKTSFKVIERADLDKILTEQGLQLKDIMDEKTRIRHGKIKGVQGLLMGKVDAAGSSFLSYSMKVHLKLDDVEKGEIVFSKDFDVAAVSPWRNGLFIGIVVIILGFIALIILIRGKTKVKENVITEDVKTRVNLAKEISKVLTDISEAKSKATDKGNNKTATMLKDLERDALVLKELVENAARGSTAMRSKGELKGTLEFDREFRESLETLTRASGLLYDKVIADGTDNIEKDVNTLHRSIKNVVNEFRNRKI
jgi:putative sterol carrier protein